MTINLTRFCSLDVDRPELTQPLTFGGYTYATDGMVVLRVPAGDTTESDAAITLREALPKYFVMTGTETWRGVSLDIGPPVIRKCEKCRGLGVGVACVFCNGSGDHACDCEHCEADCDDCSGSGIAPDRGTGKARMSCLECDGLGHYPDVRTVAVHEQWPVFGAGLITRLRTVPGPHEMAVPEQRNGDGGIPVLFRFPGGHAVVMSRYHSPDKPIDIVTTQRDEVAA